MRAGLPGMVGVGAKKKTSTSPAGSCGSPPRGCRRPCRTAARETCLPQPPTRPTLSPCATRHARASLHADREAGFHRIGTSCRCGASWRCQRPPRSGSPAGPCPRSGWYLSAVLTGTLRYRSGRLVPSATPSATPMVCSETVVMNVRIFFVVSVLPEPLSPETMIDWLPTGYP